MNGLMFITHQTASVSYLKSLEIALEGGCTYVQLRIKNVDERTFVRRANKAMKLCKSYNAMLIINDNVRVCKVSGADGVHLGASDMKIADARQLLGEKCIIGATANTFEDVVRLQAEGADYIGLGPLRYTCTKENLSPVLGVDGYRNIMSLYKLTGAGLPVFAIGGIRISDVPELMKLGLAGIAVSSAILTAETPIKETSEFISTINAYSK